MRYAKLPALNHRQRVHRGGSPTQGFQNVNTNHCGKDNLKGHSLKDLNADPASVCCLLMQSWPTCLTLL